MDPGHRPDGRGQEIAVNLLLAIIAGFVVALIVVYTGTSVTVALWIGLGVAILVLVPLLLLHPLAARAPRDMRRAPGEGPPAPVPEQLPAPGGSAGSLTMVHTTGRPGELVSEVKFDTVMTGGQHVPLTFHATALNLRTPPPVDPHLIRAADPMPAEWAFAGGRVIVHGIADDGFDVEVRPTQRIRVEMEAYQPPAPAQN